MTEEQPERLRQSEDELPVWQVEENLIGQMLGKQQCPLAAAGWTEVETFAGKRPKVIVSALGIGTAYPCDTLEVVPTCRESLTELLDPLQAKNPVDRCEVLVILLAEIGKVPFEDSMEHVTATGNIPIRRQRCDRDCCIHINHYQ